MYQQYFNFNTAPFSIAPDPHFIFMSEQHQEGLAHLLYGMREGGFVALTGEVGTGKTMLCYCLLEQLPDNVDIALVLNPKLDTLELLATICDELQIEYDEDKQSIKHLIDQINSYLLAAHAKNRKTILMIDEAQNLSMDVLEQIRLLTNLETSKTKLLQIILVGQPELKKMLEMPELRQLNQRITARYHLTPLSFAETKAYVSHRLKVSGGQTTLFNSAAIKKVYQLSGGTPRLINVICDKALLGTYSADKKEVTAKIIVQAASENYHAPQSLLNPFLKWGLISLVGLSLLLLGGKYLLNDKHPDNLSPVIKALAQAPLPEQKKQSDLAIPSQVKVKKLLPQTFKSTLIQHNNTFNDALSQLIGFFDDEVPDDLNCDQLKTINIECLYDQTDWNDVIAFNRPVIMEFAISESEYVYGLMVGLTEGIPTFLWGNNETSFPVDQVLASWNGYYLLIWQPPVKDITVVRPQDTSDAVSWIRKILAVESDQIDFFDDKLKAEVIQFQKQHQLSADGIVGIRTFIQLQNEDLHNDDPKLRNDN